MLAGWGGCWARGGREVRGDWHRQSLLQENEAIGVALEGIEGDCSH